MKPEEKNVIYRQRITAARPDLTIRELTANSEGMINDVLIVNDHEVFRFPKNVWAVKDLWHEAKILDLVREYVDIPLPEWTIYEGKDDDYPFVSYEKIPGEALRREHILRLPEGEQAILADQLGSFLYRMHNIPLAEVQSRGIGPSLTNRTAEKWLQLYEDVRRELFPLMMQFSRSWVDEHFAPLLADPTWMDCPQTFMNGDLGAYHLLYDPEKRLLNGIIDFGTAGMGDPAADFACLLDQYGESFLQRIGRNYPGIEEYIERARFWAGTLALQWALAGLRNPDDPSWFLVHIGRARDISPIGSGWAPN